VQLGLALVSGLVLAQGQPRAWGQACLTAALFMASEPARLLMGRRGAPLDPLNRGRVVHRLWLCGLLGLVCFVAAWTGAPPGAWQALLTPLLLAITLAGLMVRQREHSAIGELLAAWAFASSAFPVAVLGGSSSTRAALFTLTLAGLQTVGTITVRAYLESQRRSGQRAARVFPLVLGLSIMGAGLGSSQPAGPAISLAMAPNTLLAAWVLLAPPRATGMKPMGWALTLASLAGVLPLLLLQN
jgi:hypothetical protein